MNQATLDEERAPANRDELVRQLELVNQRQADRIEALAEENRRLRQQNTVLRQKAEAAA